MNDAALNELRRNRDEAEDLILHLSGLADALEILAWDYQQETIVETHARMRRDGIVAISNAMGRLIGRDKTIADT